MDINERQSLESQFDRFLKDVWDSEYSNSFIVKIKKAWEISKLSHEGQKRFSGEPFVSHELETANTLLSWKMDENTIIAGILHDTVEDGALALTDIEKEFGVEVSELVDGVTKVSKIKLRGSEEEEFVENLRKMFLAMAKDLRVVSIKLADRLHNMKTLEFVPEEKRERIAKETLEVYAPLAERLGMGKLTAQLEDLAFPYLNKIQYEKVFSQSKKYFKSAENNIFSMKKKVLTLLKTNDVEVKVNVRKKHLYSLWKKLQRPEINWDFEKIYDIVAMRIIINDGVQDCYETLGLIHKTYKPVPYLGVSDFIAQPKPNGYQSIHTKVFGEGGRIVEVQIRTTEMHREAEYGIAAHWLYGEAKSKGASDDVLERGLPTDSSKLGWVRQLASWQDEIKDSQEFFDAVRFDSLTHRIFVFSPKGDVYDLPNGATPVDFAYAVHTSMGNYISKAIVNGKIAALDYELKNGDVVDIMKSKNFKNPSRDWLSFVVTNLARKEIKKANK